MFSDPLDPGAIEALVTGRHGAPFDVLGRHVMSLNGEQVTIVRVFAPGAREVAVVPPDGEPLAMQRLRPEGLFSLVAPGATLGDDYLLDVRRSDRPDERSDRPDERIADPYSFPPLLSDYDLYLIGEGSHQDLYERLGAHPQRIREVDGVAFAVWAPNARRMSVVGDFNGWDERVHPMRMRSNGIWELFIPGVTIGGLYKYAALSWNQGYRVLKADPFAFMAELRPGTASRVWDLGGYVWGDEAWMHAREAANGYAAPISVYELHVGSWRPDSGSDASQVSYRALAHELAPYLQEMGYTHVELMPIADTPANAVDSSAIISAPG